METADCLSSSAIVGHIIRNKTLRQNIKEYFFNFICSHSKVESETSKRRSLNIYERQRKLLRPYVELAILFTHNIQS